MRYQAHVQPLETFGYQETRLFSIAATGKAFRNLMDSLYSRKHEAIVRELLTNAVDSHTASGNPARTFEVQLPTIMQPIFKVRDFGVGMDHEQVMNRYSVLFDSTKDQSNDEVGMYGLGSKSPFALTDGFTLRCWDNHTVRTYTAFLGDGGVPQISLAGSVQSSEPRGVEVSFAVKREDFEAFEKALLRVLKGFAHLPVGTPQNMREKLALQPKFSGDGWAVMPHNWLHHESHTVFALQGCVLYPVEMSNVDVTYRPQNTIIVLDFPIGSLTFTPSRESLTYDQATVAALTLKWKQFRDDVDQLFQKNFEGCKTDWERRLKLGDASHLPLFHLSSIHVKCAEIDEYINKMVPSYYENRYGATSEKYPFEVYRVSDDGTSVRMISNYKGYKTTKPNKAVNRQGQPMTFANNPGDLRGWRSRLGAYVSENDVNQFVAFLKPDVKNFDWGVLGHPPLLDISTLPTPPRKERVYSTYKRFLRPVGDYYSLNYVEEEDISPDAKYVFFHGGCVVRPHATRKAQTWSVETSSRSFLENYALMGGDRDKIIFVKMRGNEVYKRFRKLPLFTGTLDEYIANLSLREIRDCVAVWNYRQFEYTKTHDLFKNIPDEVIRLLPRRHPIRRLERFRSRVKSISDKDAKRYKALTDEDQFEIREKIFQRAREVPMEILFPSAPWSDRRLMNSRILSRRQYEILECASTLSRSETARRRPELVADYIRKESKS